MQLPITIGLHRSFFGSVVGALVHGSAVMAIIATPWEPWIRLGLVMALSVSAVLVWRSGRQRVAGLRLLDNGRLECRFVGDGEFRPAELLPGNTVHPWFAVIRLSVEMVSVTAVVLPDCTSAEEFRRLRVWLRWRADFRTGKDAA